MWFNSLIKWGARIRKARIVIASKSNIVAPHVMSPAFNTVTAVENTAGTAPAEIPADSLNIMNILAAIAVMAAHLIVVTKRLEPRGGVLTSVDTICPNVGSIADILNLLFIVFCLLWFLFSQILCDNRFINANKIVFIIY